MPALTITDHWLDGVKHKKTTNVGGGFKAGYPDLIVIHYTATTGINSAVDAMCNSLHRASAHLAVGRGCEVVQLVPFDRVAWHAGRSAWNGRTGLNDYSLGIEVVNAGKLERPVQVLVTWSGQPIVESEGVQLKHKNEALPAWWHCYPQPQVDKVVELCVALKKAYPTIKEIVGHDDIAPGRKVDPGPAWPMDLVRKQVFG